MKHRRIALITAILLTLLASACSKAMRIQTHDAATAPGADSSVPDTWLQTAAPQPDLALDSTIPLDAATGAAALVLDRDGAQFLAYAGEVSVRQVFTVTNRGNAPSGQLHSAVSGTGAPDFKISDTCNSTVLAMGATCVVTMVFAPSASLNAQSLALLTIADSATGASVSATLDGWLCDWGDKLILSIGPDLGTVAPGGLGAEGLVGREHLQGFNSPRLDLCGISPIPSGRYHGHQRHDHHHRWLGQRFYRDGWRRRGSALY